MMSQRVRPQWSPVDLRAAVAGMPLTVIPFSGIAAILQEGTMVEAGFNQDTGDKVALPQASLEI